MKRPAVYILANKKNGTIYTGVTSNLVERVFQHRQKVFGGFTARYGCNQLVYYEFYDEMVPAIEREKQIKAGTRRRKIELIEEMNPLWKDLYNEIVR